MKRNSRILVALLMVGLTTAAPLLQAEEYESYGHIVGRKLTSSLANLAVAPLEIPKCVIIENNAEGSNFIYGFLGGGMEGVLHTFGRLGTGLLDILTFPLPTQPSVKPLYVWQDFDTKTTYGPVLRVIHH